MGSLPFLLSKKESRIFFRQTPKKTPRNTDNARASSPAPAVRPELGSRFRRRGRRLWDFALSAGGASGGAAVFGAPASGRPNGRRSPAGKMGAGLRPAKWAPVSGPPKRQGRQTGGQRRGHAVKRGPQPCFLRLFLWRAPGPEAFFMVLELGRFFGAFFYDAGARRRFLWCGLFLWPFFLRLFFGPAPI